MTAPAVRPAVRYVPGRGYRGPDLAAASGRRAARRPLPTHGSFRELAAGLAALLVALAIWSYFATGWSIETLTTASAMSADYVFGLAFGTAVIVLVGAAWMVTWLCPSDELVEASG